MKYFTSDLLARCRSEDDAIAESASEDWERASREYEKYLLSVRPMLPKSLRFLLRRLRLHDARVLTMAFDEDPHFSLFVQPQGRFDGAEELKYRLAAQPKLGQQDPSAKDGEPLRWWLYDEIEVLDGGFTFTHSILLAGGYELQLTFFNLACRHLSWAIPPSPLAGAPQPTILRFPAEEASAPLPLDLSRFQPLGA